jgi:hypothetical protein
MAETGARDATARGQQAQASSDLKYGALAGRQRSALAASGTDVQSGSALDLLGDTRLMSDLDAQTIRNNAAREAFGYKAVAGQFKGQTDVLRQKAPYQTASSILGIATGAGGSMMQAWSDSKN